MKRIFESPTPLAFFGFLLTFLLTVAWRIPLDGQNTTFLAMARASTRQTPPPAPEPAPVPQIIDATPVQPPVYAQQAYALPFPANATPIAAPAPALLPAFAQAVAPVEPVDAPAKKKVRRARKAKADAETANDDIAGVFSAAAEGKPSKKHR